MSDSDFLYCTLKRFNHTDGTTERLSTTLAKFSKATMLKEGSAIWLSLNYSGAPIAGTWIVESTYANAKPATPVYKWSPKNIRS